MIILSAKETAVLEGITQHSFLSQRELAGLTGLSLGVINVILKKLINGGFLSVPNAGRHKLKYTLTAQGIAQANRKFYHSVLATIKSYRDLQCQLLERFEALVEQGYQEFIVPATGDLTQVIDEVLFNNLNQKIMVKKSISDSHDKSVLIRVGTTESPINFKGKVIDILSELNS